MMKRWLPAAVLAVVFSSSLGAQAPNLNKRRVTFPHGSLTLVGFSFHPDGPGPFPTILWNHGSEKSPGGGPEFDAVAREFVPAGFAVFAPMRRGHGASEGEYIQDTVQRERVRRGKPGADQATVRELETNQLEDQLAGLAYMKSQPFVDQSRVAVVGCSYGGIETLLAAEKGAGFKAAVALSPAAESLEGNAFLRERLKEAVRKITMPVFIIHPAKDASLEPGKTLSAEQQKLGKPHELKIYPATGPVAEQQHCFGGAQGDHVWAADAIAFLKKYL